MLFLSHSSEHKHAEQKCLACGHNGLSAYVKASKSGLGVPEESLDIFFYRCDQCQSLNDFSTSQDFYTVEEDDAFANFYLDVGAGIEEMIDPIARFSGLVASKQPQAEPWTFLELGCGFGFVVDYTARVLGWQSDGIEPGGYGKIGASALGVSIDQKLLGQGSAADARHYDCIYASEVLEHLIDPDGFLNTCREHLSDRGVLIMTTPVAEYIQPDNQREEVYACLFPGEHKVIYSDAGLRSALSKAGFPYVQIEKRRSSNWVIIASLDRDYEAIYARADLGQLSNEQYKAYLQKVLEGGLVSTSTQQQRVKLALCFRLTKYLVNKGQLDEALQVLAQWYGAFAMLADPELSHSAIHDCPPADRDTLLCSLLSVCLIGLTRERIEVEHYQRPYPTSGAAFLKTLGFFITVIAHNTAVEDQGRVLPIAASFLESLLGYATFAKGSTTPFYHLELISLIGPALAGLLLAKKKLGLSICEDDYPCLKQQWFQENYPVSYREIQALCLPEPMQPPESQQPHESEKQPAGIKASFKAFFSRP
jgi:SAM-dependent methyltransferase